jgi:hypothetical protein
MTRYIKLMADYASWPLWHTGEEVGNIDPATLPLSPKTSSLLEHWARMYDAQINLEDPRDALANTDELDADAFEHLGVTLWKRLREELAPTYEVWYFSELWQRVFQQPDDMSEHISTHEHHEQQTSS